MAGQINVFGRMATINSICGVMEGILFHLQLDNPIQGIQCVNVTLDTLIFDPPEAISREDLLRLIQEKAEAKLNLLVVKQREIQREMANVTSKTQRAQLIADKIRTRLGIALDR